MAFEVVTSSPFPNTPTPALLGPAPAPCPSRAPGPLIL
jgi:hypothetical protein